MQRQSLEILNIADNRLSGDLPTSISQLTSLEELDILNNQLTGSVPYIEGLVDIRTEENVGIESLSKQSTKISETLIAIIICSCIAVIIIIVALAVAIKKALRTKTLRGRDNEDSVIEMDGESSQHSGSLNSRGSATRALKKLRFALNIIGSRKLWITDEINRGGFGVVYQGVYNGRDVAIKRIVEPMNKYVWYREKRY